MMRSSHSILASGQLLRPYVLSSFVRTTSRHSQCGFSSQESRSVTLTCRLYSSWRPGGSQYQRFGSSSFRTRWKTSPQLRQFTYLGGGGAVCFVGYNMERVPVTGRWRFNWVPDAYDEEMAQMSYKQTLQQFGPALLSKRAPEVRRVERVLERLIPHSSLSDASKPWTVHVIDAPEPNAFVLPGRHVFVFRGILPLTMDPNSREDDGLATVLGHEIAHNVARHSAENLSRGSVLVLGAFVLSLFTDLSNQMTLWALDLAYNRPGSRAQETEADYIGLMMMAEACYDPRQAIAFWQRMEQAQKVKVPQFLSTHPSDHNRIARIRGWMGEALAKREQSGCKTTSSFMNDFQSITGRYPD